MLLSVYSEYNDMLFNDVYKRNIMYFVLFLSVLRKKNIFMT